MRSKQIIAQARVTNAVRDRMDRQNGFATPADGGAVDLIRTAMMAIEAGLNTKDPSCSAEAYVFLEDALKKLEA